MIEDFISFVKRIFPSIDPYEAERVKSAVRQFEETGRTYKCFTSKPFQYLAQGDIIDELPFTMLDDNARMGKYRSKGLILSNTCDLENDDNIICAPLLPISSIDLPRDTIEKNVVYNIIFFPDHRFSDYIVDLSLINTFPKSVINKAIEKEEIKKIASLSDFGYYLFLSKLTIHFMRPEDVEVQSERVS